MNPTNGTGKLYKQQFAVKQDVPQRSSLFCLDGGGKKKSPKRKSKRNNSNKNRNNKKNN